MQGSSAAEGEGSSAARGEGIASQYFALVDEYMRAYPVTGEFISVSSVRFATARILMIKTAGRCSDPTGWSEGSALRLAACLFVLLVEEHLVHTKRSVLGMTVSETHGILSSLLDTGITRAALVDEIAAVDMEGSASLLSHEPTFNRLWQSRLEESTASGDSSSGNEEDPLPLLPETVEPPLPPGPMRGVVVHRLATRTAAFRAALLCVIVAYFTAELSSYSLRPSMPVAQAFWWLAAPTSLTEDTTKLFMYALTQVMGTSIVVSIFPGDLASPAGRRFTSVAVTLTALGAIASIVASFRTSVAHVNVACTWSHAVLCVALAVIWGATAVASVSGTYTWGKMRTLYIADSLSWMTGMLALRALGPPPAYPPWNVPFGIGMARALPTLCIGLTLTSALRHRLASAIRGVLSFDHVRIDLKEVPATMVLVRHGVGRLVRGGTSVPATSTMSPPLHGASR